MDSNAFLRHHADLDDCLERLLRCAEGGECHDLAEAWNSFEAGLERHFALEESELLPEFARAYPEEATALRQQHEDLRRDLLALGIRSDLHLLRAEAVREFVTRLRAHAKREEELLYPWADKELRAGTSAKIKAALERLTNTPGATVLRA
jgi:hemerythrin-like domain-containing protein